MESKKPGMMCGGCGTEIAATESLCRECEEQLLDGKTVWDADDFDNWIECWNCGGEGFSHHECGDDTCCCQYPEENVICDICLGEGGWHASDEVDGDE